MLMNEVMLKDVWCEMNSPSVLMRSCRSCSRNEVVRKEMEKVGEVEWCARSFGGGAFL